MLAQIGGGGTEGQAHLLIKECVQRGMRVDVFVLSARHAANSSAWQGLPVHHLSTTKRRGALETIRVAWRLRRALRRGKYDLVHAMLARAHVLAPLVSPRRTSVVAWRRNLGDHVGNRALLAVERASARATDVIIANSRAVADYWEHTLGRPARTIEVIPNALEDWRFDPEPPALDSDRPLIVSVGGLRLVKGYDVLLQAVSQLRLHRDIEVVIVGGGPLYAALRDQAIALGVPLRLPGHVSDPRPWLSGAAAYVQPSRSEGSSNAVLEAMAMGCPIVATRTGTAAEDLVDCGLVVEPGNATELAVALDKVLASPTTAADLARRARERAIGRYTVNSMVSAHLSIYNRLAGRL